MRFDRVNGFYPKNKPHLTSFWICEQEHYCHSQHVWQIHPSSLFLEQFLIPLPTSETQMLRPCPHTIQLMLFHLPDKMHIKKKKPIQEHTFLYLKAVIFGSQFLVTCNLLSLEWLLPLFIKTRGMFKSPKHSKQWSLPRRSQHLQLPVAGYLHLSDKLKFVPSDKLQIHQEKKNPYESDVRGTGVG